MSREPLDDLKELAIVGKYTWNTNVNKEFIKAIENLESAHFVNDLISFKDRRPNISDRFVVYVNAAHRILTCINEITYEDENSNKYASCCFDDQYYIKIKKEKLQ